LVQLTGTACVCRLHTVAVRQAALVSDESALEACLRRCAIQTDDLYLLPLPQHITHHQGRGVCESGSWLLLGWVTV